MERTDTSQPYLSVVATSRNDDHGKNLLQRMQIFISGFIEQCRRFSIPAELIIVEWNPPSDTLRLAEALQWPVEDSPVTVRIITVPPEVHNRMEHPTALPVHQMIGKNVGIRRARGQFILSTNIDLLFSDELMRLFAQRRLQPDVMYRINRTDVPADVPLHAPVEEQLAYCATHVIRIGARLSSISLPHAQPYTYRPWTAERLVSILPPRALLAYCRLYEGALGRFLGWLSPKHRVRTLIEVPPQSNAMPESTPTPEPAAAPESNAPPRAPRTSAWLVALKSRLPNTFKHRVKLLLTLPIRGIKQVLPTDLKHRIKQSLGTILQGPRLARFYKAACLPHTNACGDFTLMARELWFSVQGYPEYETYPLHIDALLCAAIWFRGVKEIVLHDPMRVYHVEHATGSGWTPEGWALVDQRLKASGVVYWSYEDYLRVALEMRSNRDRTVFNDANWGLAIEHFEETVKCADTTALTAGIQTS